MWRTGDCPEDAHLSRYASNLRKLEPDSNCRAACAFLPDILPDAGYLSVLIMAGHKSHLWQSAKDRDFKIR